MFPMLLQLPRGAELHSINTKDEIAIFRVGRDDTIQLSYDRITVDGIVSNRYRDGERYDDRRTMTCRLMIEVTEQTLTNGRWSRMGFSQPRWCEKCWLERGQIHTEKQTPGLCVLTPQGGFLMTQKMGDRFKEYERLYRRELDPAPYAVIRVDGRAFHSYTKPLRRPFDEQFILDMREVGATLVDQIQGSIFAYGQSDEISVLLDLTGEKTQPWFGGVVQKMVSISAATATAALQRRRGNFRNPMFDSRVFTVPTASEARNYFIWRQKDAIRNSIQALGQSVFGHKGMQGRSSEQTLDSLREVGVFWEEMWPAFKWGWTEDDVESAELEFNWWTGYLAEKIPVES